MVLNGNLTSSPASTIFHCSTVGRAIALGSGATGQLQITGSELQRTTAVGMSIGASRCGSQNAVGIEAHEAANIAGIITLVANEDDTVIQFTDVASTFGSLSVQADNCEFPPLHVRNRRIACLPGLT